MGIVLNVVDWPWKGVSSVDFLSVHFSDTASPTAQGDTILLSEVCFG